MKLSHKLLTILLAGIVVFSVWGDFFLCFADDR